MFCDINNTSCWKPEVVLVAELMTTRRVFMASTPIAPASVDSKARTSLWFKFWRKGLAAHETLPCLVIVHDFLLLSPICVTRKLLHQFIHFLAIYLKGLTLIVSGRNVSILSALAVRFKNAPLPKMNIAKDEYSYILLAPFNESFFLKKTCTLGWVLSARIGGKKERSGSRSSSSLMLWCRTCNLVNRRTLPFY